MKSTVCIVLCNCLLTDGGQCFYYSLIINLSVIYIFHTINLLYRELFGSGSQLEGQDSPR